MNIDIPSHTPLGNKISIVGIWMSGGADSSLLCYMLANKIIQEKLPLQIQPITIDYKRPFKFIAGTVRIKIENLLSAKGVFKEHLVYNPPADIVWNNEELAKEFHRLNEKHIRENKFQVLYSGITTNPPVSIQQQFNWGILNDVEIKRAADILKETIRYFTKQEDKIYEFYEIKPFLI